MKKITGAAAIVFAAMLTLSLAACQGKTTYLDPVTGAPTTAPESSAAAPAAQTSDSGAAGTESSAAASTAESSAEASTAESSAEASTAESSAEASTAESSAEASTAESSAEASVAESSAAETSTSTSATAVKFTKPDDWGSEVYAYVYAGEGDKVENEAWPGAKMTDNGDGTFSATLDVADIPSPLIIFNDNTSGTKKHQYPRNNGLKYVEGKEYTIETKD